MKFDKVISFERTAGGILRDSKGGLLVKLLILDDDALQRRRIEDIQQSSLQSIHLSNLNR